jgi:two-component sensor histidine kinase
MLEQQKIDAQFNKSHTDAIINAKAGIEVYASLVSSIKSYTKNSEQFPTEIQLQRYLNDLLKGIKFNDSILINYIDTDHVFKYIITPQKIDPNNLKGLSVKSILPQKRIEELNDLMESNTIKLFTPINLREGWAGFPFNFSAKNNNDETVGYITPILDVKYLLDYFYESNKKGAYVHKFLIGDSIDLTREAIYNGSTIFNTSRDVEYYKKFNVKEEDFIYSTIELFGLKLKVGSAYKKMPVINRVIGNISYLWYIIVVLLLIVVLHQFLKNIGLNKNLQEVNTIVVSKNKELEGNLTKIQTLIKELPHRVISNIQLISGILMLQEEEYEDENIKKALRDSQNRIKSMSLVHEKLYGNLTLKDVEINEYVVQLISFIEDTLGNKALDVTKQIEIDKALIFDGYKTANLGLIINELVTNSFKHAFKENHTNHIKIAITKPNEFYQLIYKDNGSGLSDDFNFESSTSLGMQLIQILTDQLSGKLTYMKAPENTFEIYFKPIVSSFTA